MAYTCTAGWAELPLDILGVIIARLRFPADRARFAAVCRAWRSAARELESYFPWIVLPYGTFCTAGRGAACSSFRIPGFPEDDVTCLGAAHDCWLALDRTDDVVRRTPTGLEVVYARPDVKHEHAYMLHNPFSNVTVALPELDAVVGHVAETFQVRKVLMRSPAPDDVIAVTTNNWNCNIILCRPGKGYYVLDEFRVVDVAFLGDTLYGTTSGEELLAFHLGEDEDGKPSVTRIELVIKNPLAKYYYKDAWFWPQEVVDTSDQQGVGQDDHINCGGEVSSSNEEDLDDDGEEKPNQEEDDHTNGGGEVSSNSEEDLDNGGEEPNQEENDNNAEEGNQEEEDEDINEGLDNDELGEQALEDSFNDDGTISDNEVFDGFADGTVFDQEVPHEAKDELYLGRYLVQSRSVELLLVRHQWQSCPYSNPFTRKVEVLKADFSAGKWVGASDGLAKGEAIFLSRSYSKCTRAHGDIHEGLVYYGAHVDDVFDTTSCTIRNITLGWPGQCKLEELAWLFPPELVV